MKKEVKNKYAEADLYAQPVCDPIPKGEFIAYLRDGVRAVYSKATKTHLAFNGTYIRVVESYLEKHGIDPVVPDEKFFADLWGRMLKDKEYCGKSYGEPTRKKIARAVRKIVNEYFLPTGITKRRVLLEVEIDRYRRFWKLTPQSQGAVKWFEANGKKIEAKQVYVSNGSNNAGCIITGTHEIKYQYYITEENLSAQTKDAKILAAMRVLEYCDKNGFELLTHADGEAFKKYHDASDLEKKLDCRVDASTVFINIQPHGFIKDNPFVNIPLKKDSGSVRNDFFSVESIDRLKDLSTVDYKNKYDIRDRAMALVAYDLALRISELLALEMLDVYKDSEGEWCVRLRSDVQKGTKPEVTMYFFFPETKTILEKYLSIRDGFRPKTNRLFISRTGGSLSESYREQFKRSFNRLGLKSYYGNIGTPHLLRHSFATLNIELIGLKLPIYEMMKRLRHTRIEVTIKHYIHNNPYLNKLKHGILRNLGKKETGIDLLSKASLPDLEHYLSDKLGVDPSVIGVIRSKYKKASAKPIGNESDNVVYISEPDAMERVKHLSIPVYALRKYALCKSLCLCDVRRDPRYGKNFRYAESFIEDLAKNWIPAKGLMTKLQLSSTDFYRHLKKNAWRNKKIGTICYVFKADCL